ncbi:virion RNA polymerase protein [Rhizobium phage RHph_N38]|uniref:Virion RNA polymerase protein n=1 Tax=Rhizobium phage RHph_N38 TaxID=2509750 RepID=A0A7S5R3R1_9CAUD|nr:virion RNA polymerase protein [Rhizobium phage RHph_N38]QIG70535.1 virion RNA polymerase protein [Rhizobium phage RHph_N38]
MVDFPQGPLSPLDQQRVLRADTTARVTEALAAATAPKQAELSSVSQGKKALLGGASDMIAAAVKNENAPAQDQFVLDAQVMSPFDLEAKYGPGSAQAQRNLRGAQKRSQQTTDLASNQNEVDSLGDLANSTVQGIVGLGSGLAGLAVSPFSSEKATGIVEAGNEFNKTLQSFQSDALRQARQEEAIASEVEAADNKAQQENDSWKYGAGGAGLLRIGRDAASALERSVESTPIANDLVGNALGSLVAAGPVAKALKAVGVAEAAAVPASIGIQEGGGSYAQTVTDVLNDPGVVNSPLYQERIAAGDTPDEAKRFVANRAGQIAAPAQAVAAAVTGKIVSKFEGNPFKPASVLTAAKNIGKELIEEIPQTASGDLISNVVQKDVSNPNKDVLEGVGEDIGKTVPGVIGSTAITQAPGVGIHAIASAAREVYKGGATLVERTNDNLNKRNEQASPVSAEKVEAAAKELPVKAAQVTQIIQDNIPENITPKQREKVDAYLDNISKTMAMTPEEVASQPFEMQTNDRMEAMIQNGKRSADKNLSEDDRLHSALWVLDQMTKNDALFNQDIPEALNHLEEDHPVRTDLDSYLTSLQFLNNHPVLRAVADKINQMQQTREVSPAEVTQSLANDTADLAAYNPSGVNATTATSVLYQADRGFVALNPAQRAALENKVSLLRATQKFKSDLETLEATPKAKTPEQVAEEIIGKSLDKAFPSMNDHLGTIAQAIKRGDNKGARYAAQRLMKFAKHMSSKVNALNHSYDAKGEEKEYGSAGQKIYYSSPRLAKQIYAEAKMVVEVANSVAKNMPEFGIHETPIVSLRPAIRGINAKTYTRTSSDAFEAKSEPKIEPKVEATPAPLVQESKPVEPVEETKVEAVQVPEKAPSKGVEEVTSVAQEKEQTEGVGTEPEPEARTVENAFPNLIQGSNFRTSFNLAEEGNTLAGNQTPFQTVMDALVNRASLINQRGSDIRYAYDAKLGRSYADYLGFARPIFGSLRNALKDYFSEETTYNKKKTTRAALFEQGVTFLDSIEGRALNILEQSDKGFAYNQELIQKAILAGLHWNLNADKQVYRQTEEELRQAYGLSQDAVLDQTTIDALNRGVSIAEAKRSLGDLITKFWGIKGKDNAPLGFTKGIPEGVAAEVLGAMSKVGLISFEQIELPNGKTPIRVMFDTREEKIQEKIKALDSAPAVIADAVLIENPDDPHIGEPPRDVPDTQMRNPLTKNTAQQKIVIQRANNIPFYVNESVMNFLDDIGENDLIDLMGGMSNIPDGLNKNHRKSIEGINTGIKNSYRNTQRQLAQIESHARIAGVHITEMPQYYEHNISRVGRLHMQGSANPQADKIARELFVATVSQMDLTNPDHKEAFFLTLAQALGVKTELKAPQLAVEEVQKKLAGEFKDAADHVSAWRSGSSKIDPDVLKKSLGKDLTMKAIHALIAWHDYRKDENATDFTHYLSLEADGKTDGPINAIMNFTAGEFTAYWVQNMARGGLYIGETGKTLADHYSSSEENSKDLYQTATDKLITKIADFRKAIAGTPVEPMMQSLLRIMNVTTEGNLSFNSDTDKLTLKRGIAKNPLTITVYGSGIDGIAGKVAGGLVDAIYEAMSAVGSGNKSTLGSVFGVDSDQFSKDLNDLISKGIVVTEDGTMEVKEYKSSKRNFDPTEFTFTQSELLNLKNNVKALFVRQLDASIREMMGPSMVTTKRVQTAIQVMSLVAKDVFDKEVKARLAAKGDKAKNFLSQRELNEIYKQTAQYHPVIDTGTQEFFVGGTERGDLGSRTFSKTLSGQLETPAYVYSPSEAGVGGVPYVVIGTGDGQMVQNIFANTNIDNVLAVFDGIELPASKIKEYSEQINKAVYDAWQANPVADIAAAFRAFVRRDPFSLDLSEDTDAKLGKVLEGLPIEDLAQALQKDAESIAARKAALNQVPLSVDHMASAAAPYSSGSQDTAVVGFESFPAIADTMNKIVGANRVVDESGPVLTDPMDLSTVGRVDEFNNRIIPVNELPNIPGLDPSHAEIIRLGSKSISSDWSVVVGTPDSLNAFELQNNPNSILGEYGLGKIDFAVKTIYITNPSSETLAHEILHASTFAKVQFFYEGKELSIEDREAIIRLEGLLGEFVATVYSGESSAVIGAREIADATINTLLNKADVAHRLWEKTHDSKYLSQEQQLKAEALNEFMAWVLTNKNLATVASETKVLNPAFRLIGKALAYIRNLIFGGNGPKVSDDLWSNLRFNTRILLATPVDNNTVGNTRLYQSAQFGSSDRLTNLADRFFGKVIVALDTNDATVKTDINQYVVDTIDLADSFENHGWSMSQQERSVFTSVVAALGVAHELDETALAGIDTLYSHAMKSLTVEDLMDDPNSNDPNDRYMAQERYNSLQGIFGTVKDPKGRTSLMPSFLALAMVNDRLRQILEKLKLPDIKIPAQEDKLDTFLTNLGMNAVDKFTTILSGQKGTSVGHAINSLAQVLVAQQDEDKFFILNQVGNKISAFENYVRENIQNLSGKWDNKLKKYVASNPSNKWASFAATMSRMTLGIINDDVASSIAESVTGILNRQEGWTTLREFFGEMSGRLTSNALIWDMITKVRTVVQQTRQQFREQLPAKIAGHFTRKLSQQEWEHLYKGLAKTDLSSLVESVGLEKTLEILESPAAVAQELQKLQLRLRFLDPVNEQKLMTKVSELAVFMNTGEASANLLRNAYAIANLLGEGGRKTRATQELIDVIDQLVTLTAVDKLDRSIMKTLSTLVQDEPEGMEFTLAYLTGQRKEEMARVTNDVAKANHYKGWIPLENENGHQLTIINDHYGTQLLPLGFKRVADYKGSKAEGSGVSRGYYYAPVSGKTTYNQGILQTVHSTASGVDPVTGQTIGTVSGGIIRDAAEVARITRRRGSNGGFEALLPVYDALGDVVAYERHAHPQEVKRLNPNRNLSEMIGAWKGRQVEELYARQFNSELIKNLAHIWGNTKVVDHNQFVDLFASNDKVIADAVKLISPEVKAEIEREFGGKEFWVRKDMINDAVGFRQASVGDAWNGTTRWSDPTVERFRKVATAVFSTVGKGNDAYKRLVQAEQIAQKGVFFAKNNIVVKSVIVPVSNILSNMWQLLHAGVPVKDIIRGMGTKTIEVNKYIQNKSRQIELEADLRVAEVRKDVRAIRKLQTEWNQIEDSNKRLSIWKLIEEGEFTAISQGGPTQEDLAIANGKYIDYVENLAKKLPGPAQTLGRYAMISKDTALFQVLARATQYGDFLAKGILYDHLRKTMAHKEAVANVSEEFINYNRLAGRTRNYLESIGVLWFWNYKIRAVKIAARMIRRNPLRALLSMSTPVLPIVGAIGSPMEDNFFSVLEDGKLGYSIGPGMGLNSPWLNPWLNLVR